MNPGLHSLSPASSATGHHQKTSPAPCGYAAPSLRRRRRCPRRAPARRRRAAGPGPPLHPNACPRRDTTRLAGAHPTLISTPLRISAAGDIRKGDGESTTNPFPKSDDPPRQAGGPAAAPRSGHADPRLALVDGHAGAARHAGARLAPRLGAPGVSRRRTVGERTVSPAITGRGRLMEPPCLRKRRARSGTY